MQKGPSCAFTVAEIRIIDTGCMNIHVDRELCLELHLSIK